MTGWRRLDPRMLAIRPVDGLIRAALPILAIFVSGRNDGPGQLVSLGIAVVVILVGMSHWFTTTYRIGDGQVELRTGLLRRRHLAVPLDRVRSVDVTASPMHRVLGVAIVKIGTGRQDKGRRDELRLDAVSAHEAQSLRAELLHRGDPAAAAAAGAVAPTLPGMPTFSLFPTVEPAETVLSAFDPAWIRFAPFTLSGLATVGAVTGYVFHLLNEAHIDPERVGSLRSTASFVARTPLPLVAVVLVVLLLALAAAFSTAGYLLAFWGFRLTRHPGGTLRIQRGLLTTRSVSLEERRLRGVEVREPLLLRIVGGARCVAIATGMRENRGSDKGGELLQPPAPLAQTHRVAALVLGGTDPTGGSLRPHGSAARRRRYVRALTVSLAIVALAVGLRVAFGGPDWPWWLSLALPPVAGWLAGDRYRSLGHAIVDGYLVRRLGSIDRRTAALRCEGIIGWRFHQSFFQRRVGLVTLVATTAGGKGSYEVPDVTAAEALGCADEAVPGLLTPFLAHAAPARPARG